MRRMPRELSLFRRLVAAKCKTIAIEQTRRIKQMAEEQESRRAEIERLIALANIDAATIRQLAVEASADPRTVLKRLLGQPVRGVARFRVDGVLERWLLQQVTR